MKFTQSIFAFLIIFEYNISIVHDRNTEILNLSIDIIWQEFKKFYENIHL